MVISQRKFRYLNSKDLEFEKRIKRYIILRKRKEAKERKLRETLFSGLKVNDTVCFKCNLGFASREQRSFFIMTLVMQRVCC